MRVPRCRRRMAGRGAFVHRARRVQALLPRVCAEPHYVHDELHVHHRGLGLHGQHGRRFGLPDCDKRVRSRLVPACYGAQRRQLLQEGGSLCQARRDMSERPQALAELRDRARRPFQEACRGDSPELPARGQRLFRAPLPEYRCAAQHGAQRAVPRRPEAKGRERVYDRRAHRQVRGECIPRAARPDRSIHLQYDLRADERAVRRAAVGLDFCRHSRRFARFQRADKHGGGGAVAVDDD